MPLRGLVFTLQAGEQEVILVYELDEVTGIAIPMKNKAPTIAESLEEDGIEIDEAGADPRTVYPEDGEDFIRNLPTEFSGSRTWADVEDTMQKAIEKQVTASAELWVTDGVTGKSEMFFRYELDDDGVAVAVVNNAPSVVEELEDDGLETDEDSPRVLFPEDGEDFIRHLADGFRGGYMRVVTK